MKYNIGIDLGTTFSTVAVVDESGRPRILPNLEGRPLTPSVIYFDGGEPIVGDKAKEMQALGEENVASFFKRSMGDKSFVLHLFGLEYDSTDLSAILLRELKAGAEAALGASVSDAVITVPAYFNNFQREATIEAGRRAGLKVLRIINEPTAAALAYGMRSITNGQISLVYDLGGGTFDVTLVRITPTEIEVIATDGNHELGGKDWDDRIATYLAQRFKEERGVDPLEDSEAFNDLLVRCESAKKHLSARDRTRVGISYMGEKESYEISRSQFEAITRDLMDRTQNLTEQVLREAGFGWRDLDGVLLVGGSTRMPMVWEYVERMSGKKPLTGVNVDEAVALGAAIQAAMDSTEPMLFALSGRKRTKDVMSHSLGMVAESEDKSRYVNSIIIPKNKPIPCQESRPYRLRTGLNRPNELEVYMLQGESTDPTQCLVLGRYVFCGITHVPEGAVLDVEYAYDRNGVVVVKAREQSTGKELEMAVQQVNEDLSWLTLPPEEKVVSVHISIVLCIDISASMSNGGLDEAKKAAKEFLKKSDMDHTSVGLVAFESSASVICPPTSNDRLVIKGIDILSTAGSTDMAGGLRKSHAELQKTDDPRFIVLLTDGYPDDPNDALKAAKQICDDGIELITVGTGGADQSFLKKLACSDENSLFAQAGQVVGTFSKIAQVITDTRGDISGVGGQKGGKKRGLLSLLK